ncbi:MAG: amylo-alpha-1,6-glucosidase, partial [Anaerolineae bacterium]
PVEIQALWHRMLTLLDRVESGSDWAALAVRVARSLAGRFRRADDAPGGSVFLSDCLHASPGTPAADAVADDHLRPNQLLALTLGAVRDPDLAADVIRACECLLVPGAVRSLADRPVTYALPVAWNGRVLNDPTRPYRGCYGGDEDTSRKPAYHNGTAWTWLFPSYCEALYGRYGAAALPAARAQLGSVRATIESGCLGQVPERRDGSRPHREKGCGAQAWGVTEAYRVLALLTRTS